MSKNKPFSYKGLEADLRGKVFLVGLTFVDQADEFIEAFQTHGTFAKLISKRLFQIVRNDGSPYLLPLELSAFEIALPGNYRERSTGIVVSNPDFIVKFTITIKNPDSIPELKAIGFQR